jgi:DNA-binding PadR family transcriptional regulator
LPFKLARLERNWNGWPAIGLIESPKTQGDESNQGTLYPVLLKLEQEGAIASEWGASENNRRARFYWLTRAGNKHLEAETRDWETTTVIIERFFEAKAEDLS